MYQLGRYIIKYIQFDFQTNRKISGLWANVSYCLDIDTFDFLHCSIYTKIIVIFISVLVYRHKTEEKNTFFSIAKLVNVTE